MERERGGGVKEKGLWFRREKGFYVLPRPGLLSLHPTKFTCRLLKFNVPQIQTSKMKMFCVFLTFNTNHSNSKSPYSKGTYLLIYVIKSLLEKATLMPSSFNPFNYLMLPAYTCRKARDIINFLVQDLGSGHHKMDLIRMKGVRAQTKASLDRLLLSLNTPSPINSPSLQKM